MFKAGFLMQYEKDNFTQDELKSMQNNVTTPESENSEMVFFGGGIWRGGSYHTQGG